MKKIKVCMAFLLTIMLVLSSTTVSYAYLPEDSTSLVCDLFRAYYNNEIGEDVNDVRCFDEYYFQDSSEYYLIHFDSINAEEKPYYNRFGDKDVYFEYSEMTNKLFESGFAVFYGDPYITRNANNIISLPELYEKDPVAVEFILKDYAKWGIWEVMKKHSWGKVGDADGDFEISISDATEIQKVLAGLKTIEGVNFRAADIGNKGALNISDATNIQFYLADLVDKL